MSKTWKWIIGILIGLLILAVIVAIPFGMHQFASGYTAQFPARGFDRDLGPGMMGRGEGNYYWHQGMMGGSQGFSRPMAYGLGFFAFGIFRLIIPLAVLGLAIYGVIALFKRRPASIAPAEAVPSAPVVSSRSCGSCGKPAMDEWKNCPYCGNSL
jgi:TRAP-type C4-dicarboxylate transport system permease small subunit